MDGERLFSVITPTSGRRPRALQKAVQSVDEAVMHAGLDPHQVEMLIGFDGVKGRKPEGTVPIRSINFPPDNDWGNGIRQMLLKIAGGRKVIFLDDDNVLKPRALQLYLMHFDTEMIVGRIDTQLAFDKPYIPEREEGSLVRQCNIDPLCLCLSRELVVDRCGGWKYQGRYEADYLNILDWHRRARSVTVIDELVGVYDAGRSLDGGALSRRQMNMLDRMAAERGVKPVGSAADAHAMASGL
ncbi:glycosyltransferase family A protein [Salidesulfovibrio brasiliensis]|uniref:glycosyltransferase family A protein n=1 Tax=Salidesulfovibrio brasiliensis TaxID=221711 RepID=UPI0006D28542|nr:glycosyltransferase family A protein [Salidesulfovibrio brasiliensis]